MKLEYLECGKFLAPHGVRGALKAEIWCDSPAVAAALPCLYLPIGDGKYRGLRLLQASSYKGGLLLTVEGITTPEEAVTLRGATFYAKREDLDPRGERVFYAETYGLPVLDADSGRTLGRIREVDTSRKTVLYVIDTERGEVLVPDAPEFIKEIDTERFVKLRPIPGLFDEI